MTAQAVPRQYWRSYGAEPLPTGREALDEPFSAFPSWFLRITCDRCGKDRMVNEAHAALRDRALRDIPSACATTAAADCRDGPNCSPASRALAAARCGGSC